MPVTVGLHYYLTFFSMLRDIRVLASNFWISRTEDALGQFKTYWSDGVNKREVLIVTPAACPAVCPSPLEGTTQQPTVPFGPSSPHLFSSSDVQNPRSSLCYSTQFTSQGHHMLFHGTGLAFTVQKEERDEQRTEAKNIPERNQFRLTKWFLYPTITLQNCTAV